MSEQYMATVICQRLEELRSDVFFGWTKARIDEIKDLFDEYLSNQVGERKDLFLKVAELEGKVAELESRLTSKAQDNLTLLELVDNHKKSYDRLHLQLGQHKAFVRDIMVDLCDHFGLEPVVGGE